MKKLCSLLLCLTLLALAGCGAANVPQDPASPDVSPTPMQSQQAEQEPAASASAQATAPNHTSAPNPGNDGVAILLRKGGAVYSGCWEVNTGFIIKNASPLLTTKGAGSTWDVAQSICTWDGACAFVVSNSYATVSAAENSQATVEPVDWTLQYADGCTIKLSDTLCEVVEKGRSYTVSLSDMPAPITGEGVTSWLLSSHRDKDALYLFFAQSEAEQAYLFYAKADPSDGSVTWSEPLSMPEEHCGGNLVQYGLARFTAVTDSMLYLSGYDTILCLDYRTNELRDLSSVTDRLDSLLSDMVRASGLGRTFATVPVGQCGDLVVCSMQYRGESDANRSFVAYYAIEGDSLAGILLVENTDDASYKITTYAGDGAPLTSLEPDYTFVAVSGTHF